MSKTRLAPMNTLTIPCLKLVRVYAWWMRYKFKLKCKVKKKCPPPEREGKTLCADDFKEASLALYQIFQIESFK